VQGQQKIKVPGSTGKVRERATENAPGKKGLTGELGGNLLLQHRPRVFFRESKWEVPEVET